MKLTITLSPRHRDLLDKYAAQRDWSRGQVIAKLLDRVVDAPTTSAASTPPATQTAAVTGPARTRKAPAPRKPAAGRTATKAKPAPQRATVTPIPKVSKRGRR